MKKLNWMLKIMWRATLNETTIQRKLQSIWQSVNKCPHTSTASRQFCWVLIKESWMSKLGYNTLFPLFITVCTHIHTLLHLCELWSSARSGHLPRNNSLFSLSSSSVSVPLSYSSLKSSLCLCSQAHTQTRPERDSKAECSIYFPITAWLVYSWIVLHAVRSLLAHCQFFPLCT